MDHSQVILRPLVTEKSSEQADARNTYSFEVAPAASKDQIKAAIENLYSVKVLGVRTLTRKDKPKRSKYRLIHTGGYKRAMVTLDANSKIELF